MFERLFFPNSHSHELKDGSVLSYRGGQFYHVEQSQAQEFIAAGIAEEESVREARLKAEAEAAEAVAAAKQDNPNGEAVPALQQSEPAGPAAAEHETQPRAPEE